MQDLNIAIKIHFKLMQASIKSMLEYRMDFIVGILSQLMFQFLELVSIFIVYRVANQIDGWNLDQVLLIYGILNMVLGIVDMFFDGFYNVGPIYIRSGTFDTYLLRPYHSILSVSASSKSSSSIGYILIGIGISLVSLLNLGIGITPLTIVYLLFIAVCGGAIIGAILTTLCCLSFWIFNSNEVMWAFFQLYKFAQYPISIFSMAIRFVITFIIPFALVSYYPALLLLGHKLGLISLLAPVFAILFWVITVKIWNYTLRYYKSTGT